MPNMEASRVRRRLPAEEDIKQVAVSASTNVPARVKGKARTLTPALESFSNLPDYLRDNEVRCTKARQPATSAAHGCMLSIYGSPNRAATLYIKGPLLHAVYRGLLPQGAECNGKCQVLIWTAQ